MVNPVEKFRLNNRLSYLATGVLISCFLLALVIIILPKLPDYPADAGERRLFVSSWNFAATLMWIVVLRIQIFNELHDRIERRRFGRRVTPWVKFWFIASALLGSATIAYVSYTYAAVASIGVGSAWAEILALASIVAWVALVAASTSLFLSRGRFQKGVLSELGRSLSVHRRLLAPSSVLFFFSVFLFPIFFLL